MEVTRGWRSGLGSSWCQNKYTLRETQQQKIAAVIEIANSWWSH